MTRQIQGDGVCSFSGSHSERKQRMLKGLTYVSRTCYSESVCLFAGSPSLT